MCVHEYSGGSDFGSDFGSDNLISLSYSMPVFSANSFGLFSLRNLLGSASADFLLNWKCISLLPVKPEVHQLTPLLNWKCIICLLVKPEVHQPNFEFES